YYLRSTGRQHPGADEVIASGRTEWREIVERLTSAPLPAGKRIEYQKQMTHHLLPEVERAWLGTIRNCFLIRDPAEVIASYIRKNGDPAPEDVGFVQQGEIFDKVCARTGEIPAVIDAADVLENPERILRLLCDSLGVEWTDTMLSWPAGLRETDGVWAKHWYSEVVHSTSFRPPRREAPPPVPPHLREVHAACQDAYARLHGLRLR
ncbi:MAG: HAD family hydrolase, partial [Verrucomicrobiota bacterium]|nr:HAD family hydrolase [Verrucomicrobiota bacterium]